jgi:hypothetical protein
MTTKTTPKQLEQIAEKVRTGLDGKKQIFPVLEFPTDHVVNWEGEEIDWFLVMCLRCGGPLVYTCEWRVTQANLEQDEVFSGRIGELLQLDVAFLQDGYFHRFRQATEWFEKYCSGQEEESPFMLDEEETELTKKQATRIKDCILGLGKEEISEEFVREFGNSGNQDDIFEYRLYQFISEKYHLPASSPMTFHHLGDKVEKAFTRFSNHLEERLVEILVPNLIEWLGKNKRDKVLKVDVQVFLSENHLRLNNNTVTVLWRKAKYLLDQGGL